MDNEGYLKNNERESDIIKEIVEALLASEYHISATGFRGTAKKEIKGLVSLIREATDSNISTFREMLDNYYKYHPSTIAFDKSYQKSSCPDYVEGHCDCYLPDVDHEDSYCYRVRKEYLESTDYRNTREYKEWRKTVFTRDDYTCQNCSKKGGSLNAHHIKTFKKYPLLRYETSNGVTLCVPCHRKVHSNA